MRRIVDFSDYQTGLDLDTVASAVDGAWAKAGDWSWIRAHGWPGDYVHVPAIDRFLQLGKPIGSYLFVRPGWTDPVTQIDQWRQNTPNGTTLKPMIDLEVPGTLSGASLTDWVTEALALTADRFEVDLPVLYWSAAFQSANGMGIPSAPHYPMVAEYHRGYTPYEWSWLSGWENYAYSAYGGPDVPGGYGGLTPLDMIWQFTSSAQIPGFSGLVDCSFCNETVFAAITASDTLGPVGTTPTKPPVQEDDDVKYSISDPDGTLYFVVNLDATPLSAYAKSVHDVTGLSAEFPHKKDAGGGDLVIDKTTIGIAYHVRPQDDGVTLASVQAGVNNSYGALSTALNGLTGSAESTKVAVAAVADAVGKISVGHIDAEQLAAALVPALGLALTGPRVTGDGPSLAAAAPSRPNADALMAAALSTLADAVASPDHGIVAQTAREVAKIRTPAGQEPTAAEYLDALQRTAAGTVAKAALAARAVVDATAPVDPPTEPTTASSETLS